MPRCCETTINRLFRWLRAQMVYFLLPAAAARVGNWYEMVERDLKMPKRGKRWSLRSVEG